MMNNREEYFGIRFNGYIPKKNKINSFSKEVEITFLGKAYLIERTEDDKIEKIEIENYHKLEKEGKYEIEFVNKENYIFNLQIEIEKSYLFIIILFLIGALIFTACMLPISKDETIINKVFSLIDLSALSVDIEGNDRYVFEVDFKNIISSNIELPSTINAKSVVRNKIAPGTDGEFSIIISTESSTVDMKYSVNFEDITNEKPNNLLFKVKGSNNEYSSLQELEKYLKGIAKKETKTEYVIEWRWPYDVDNSQDIIDTNDGATLKNYKFRIHVYGEEAI